VSLFDNGIDCGQSQSRTGTDGFRCKEWLKDARAEPGIDADASARSLSPFGIKLACSNVEDF